MLRFCDKFVTKERVCSSCFRNSITTNGQQHKKPVHESFKCQLTVKPFRINQVLQVLQLTENNFACTSQACSNFPKLKSTFSRQCLEIPSQLMNNNTKNRCMNLSNVNSRSNPSGLAKFYRFSN